MGGESVAGKKLKSQSGWKDDNGTSGNGTDAYGFSAFPAGYRDDNGGFGNVGDGAYFWSATEGSSYGAYGMYLNNFSEDAGVYYFYKYYAFSVRCLKD